MIRSPSRLANLILPGLVFVAAVQPAAAQRLGPEPSEPAHVQILARFSTCIAHRSPRRAEHLLAMDYRTDAYQRDLRRLATGNSGCLGRGMLRFSAVLFAGGMAETLMRERGLLTDLASRVALDPARAPFAARDGIELMSICVVRAAPVGVATLLQTAPASEAETAALQALTPRLADCLGAGEQLRVNRIALRSLLALAAWHLGAHNGWARSGPAAG